MRERRGNGNTDEHQLSAAGSFNLQQPLRKIKAGSV